MNHFSNTFCNQIITWFEKNRRALPWRSNRNWYTVWISEVMLQQTQVRTVIPYFKRFLIAFPTVKELADANLQHVLKLWEGLGYYSRARNMHQAAQMIMKKYGGILPDSEAELRQLPGFGPYITNAILSIAFGKPLAVLDGNVKRIMARYYQLSQDIRETKTHRKIQNLVDDLLDLQRPDLFNEAMMELGATVCRPAIPLCLQCPLSESCRAYLSSSVSEYPYKPPRKIKEEKINLALICYRDGKVLFTQRPPKGLLAGMWEFPLYTALTIQKLHDLHDQQILKSYNLHGKPVLSLLPVNHSYTHFDLKLYSRIYYIQNGTFYSDFYSDFKWIAIDQINHFPIHRAVSKQLGGIVPLLKIIAER